MCCLFARSPILIYFKPLMRTLGNRLIIQVAGMGASLMVSIKWVVILHRQEWVDYTYEESTQLVTSWALTTNYNPQWNTVFVNFGKAICVVIYCIIGSAFFFFFLAPDLWQFPLSLQLYLCPLPLLWCPCMLIVWWFGYCSSGVCTVCWCWQLLT